LAAQQPTVSAVREKVDEAVVEGEEGVGEKEEDHTVLGHHPHLHMLLLELMVATEECLDQVVDGQNTNTNISSRLKHNQNTNHNSSSNRTVHNSTVPTASSALLRKTCTVAAVTVVAQRLLSAIQAANSTDKPALSTNSKTFCR
jgi:hypothetical protein